MKGAIVIAILAAALGGVLVRECFPKREQVIERVPEIVTVFDTVRDTVRLRGPRVVTTDTVQIVIRQTVHDTVQINVGCDTAARPPLWPVLNAQIGKSRGDTSRVTTFSLRSGKPTVSLFWTPGPLRSLWADTTGIPRLDFYEPPKPQGVSLWTKVKWTAVGYGSCSLVRSIGDAIQR